MVKKWIFILILIFVTSCNTVEQLEIVEKHDNGKKKIVHKYFESGKNRKIVEKLEYNEIGQVVLIRNFDDNSEKRIGYYKNGNKEYEEVYKDGKEHGKWIWWHENGVKSCETDYKYGKLHGKEIEWDNEGKKIGEGEYKNGTGKFEGWYENGGKKLRVNSKEEKDMENGRCGLKTVPL